MPAGRRFQRTYKATHRQLLQLLDRALPGHSPANVVFVVPTDRIESCTGDAAARIPDQDLEQLEQEISTFGLAEPFLGRRLAATSYALLAECDVYEAAVRAGVDRVRLIVVDATEDEARSITLAAAERLPEEWP